MFCRYYHALAGFAGDDSARLDALIQIGRLFLAQREYRKAKNIVVRALSFAMEKNARREIGLLYGYLAECHIGLGQRKKVITENFFNLFSN